MNAKLCRGPTHETPVLLPLDERHWAFYRTGEFAGRPARWCKACHNFYSLVTKNGPHGYIEVGLPVLVAARELVERCGGVKPAARKYGFGPQNLRVLLASTDPVRMRKSTAQRILSALAEQRKLDRKQGRVSEQFITARRTHAQRTGAMLAHLRRSHAAI